MTAARPAPAKNESRKRAPPSSYSAHTSGIPATFRNAAEHAHTTRNVLRVVCITGGIVVAFKPVLWSPVGAPAGVPGPRRNADDCDAGWFAPVATRRRSIFGAFQAPSPWLAVSPRGDDPPEPPDGSPAPQAFTCGPGSGRHPCGPEGRCGARNLLAAGTPPAPIPLPLPRSLGSGAPGHLRCPDNSVAAHSVRSPRHGRAPTSAEPATGHMCPAESGAATAEGCLGTEFCPRPGHPPAVASSQPEARCTGRRWVSWARSSVRAQLTHRPPIPPRVANLHQAPATRQPTEGIPGIVSPLKV